MIVDRRWYLSIMSEQSKTNLPRNFFILFLSFRTSKIPNWKIDAVFTRVRNAIITVALSWMVGTYFGCFFPFLFCFRMQMSTHSSSQNENVLLLKLFYYWWVSWFYFFSSLFFPFKCITLCSMIHWLTCSLKRLAEWILECMLDARAIINHRIFACYYFLLIFGAKS